MLSVSADEVPGELALLGTLRLADEVMALVRGQVGEEGAQLAVDVDRRGDRDRQQDAPPYRTGRMQTVVDRGAGV